MTGAILDDGRYPDVKSFDPLEDDSEVVSHGGEDGIDGISFGVCEVVPVHSVLIFHMPDHGFDGGAAFHDAFDCWCDPPFLPCGIDFERVGERHFMTSISGIG